VVAEGYEGAGFFQGVTGNLSDDVASAVAGDLGGGDKLSDRTIVVDPTIPGRLFPASKGTHAISFPPSPFMTIHLVPFDQTPEGKYVLALCPTTVMSHCDCAFEAFTIGSRVRDGGVSGSGGAGGAGGNDGSTRDAHAAGGSGHDAGAMCPDM